MYVGIPVPFDVRDTSAFEAVELLGSRWNTKTRHLYIQGKVGFVNPLTIRRRLSADRRGLCTATTNPEQFLCL